MMSRAERAGMVTSRGLLEEYVVVSIVQSCALD